MKRRYRQSVAFGEASEETYTLYGGDPPHVSTDTSVGAARSMKPHVSKLAGEVLAHIDRPGGATCWEVETALGMKHQTASARIRELVLKGRVVDSGNRRKTSSNRPAIVWVVVS